MRWIVVLAISACSAPAPHGPPSVVEKARTPPPPSATQCPAEYGATGACDGYMKCTYPAGTCFCVEPCMGGAAPPPPPPGPPPNPYRWLCTPAPPAVRPDGCPGVEPEPRTACTGNLSCHYALENNGPCVGGTYRCTNGVWSDAVMDEPPP